MDAEAIYQKLTPIFREVFDDDSLVPHPRMTAAEVENWDSLSNIRLIVAIEEALSVNFTTAEVAGLKDVSELVAVIQRKVGG
jgi:acyl carrier protein